MNAVPTMTPWGPPTKVREIAGGIVQYETARHGGIWLDDCRVKEMPEELQALPPWAGYGWYEQDAEWALVVMSFPRFFSPDVCACAIRTARDWLSQSIDMDGFCKSAPYRAVRAHAGL